MRDLVLIIFFSISTASTLLWYYTTDASPQSNGGNWQLISGNAYLPSNIGATSLTVNATDLAAVKASWLCYKTADWPYASILNSNSVGTDW